MGVPPYEGWVERQIREATERGEFDDLPGAGRPLRGIESSDPDWWVKGMMAREGLDSSDALPPVLQLRREAAGYPQSLADERWSRRGVGCARSGPSSRRRWRPRGRPLRLDGGGAGSSAGDRGQASRPSTDSWLGTSS